MRSNELLSNSLNIWKEKAHINSFKDWALEMCVVWGFLPPSVCHRSREIHLSSIRRLQHSGDLGWSLRAPHWTHRTLLESFPAVQDASTMWQADFSADWCHRRDQRAPTAFRSRTSHLSSDQWTSQVTHLHSTREISLQIASLSAIWYSSFEGIKLKRVFNEDSSIHSVSLVQQWGFNTRIKFKQNSRMETSGCCNTSVCKIHYPGPGFQDRSKSSRGKRAPEKRVARKVVN